MDIALIGLAVMGQNLVLNMEDHGFGVAVYNRTASRMEAFLAGPARDRNIAGAGSVPDLVARLKRPRRVMMLVKAGEPVDALIGQLLPHLEPGDIVIDGGNSNFEDTNRRTAELEAKGLLFVGTGVSGGEEGARHGPSIMPGGSPGAWPHVKDIFQSIAAKVVDGSPCCDWVGEAGAGHYVKMVHNGIEYGDMQLICEAYHLMSAGLGMDADGMSEVFRDWNRGDLDSFLIEITSDILAYRDGNDEPLLDRILDKAGQKGTGKWTVISSAALGIPVTLIAEAVYARCISSFKEERVAASRKLPGPDPLIGAAREDFLEKIRQALYASKIVSYAQGYMLMRAAAGEYRWNLDYGAIALMWRGGCIIRSRFLNKIKEAYERKADLTNLLMDSFFASEIRKCQDAWREVVATAIRHGIPAPAMSTALGFYDSFRTERLPANLLQAQRDYFGAHTYQRIDAPPGESFHTNWTGRGGEVSSSTYNV